MLRLLRPRLLVPLALLLLVPLGACILVVRQIETRERPPAGDYAVRSPVKAHLLDGSVVMYRHGVTVARDTLHGSGMRFDFTLTDSVPTQRVPLDSVAAMESFRTGVNIPATLALSIPATYVGVSAAGAIATILLIAIFGSCPTIYVDNDGTFELQAEAFSYSIAPLFEARDVARLHVWPDAAGIVSLEVRNEALETHYINHFELLEIRHAPGERVVPDPRGRLLALGTLATPTSARDRAGRDLLSTLAAADELVFKTDPRTLDLASARDLGDHIDLVLPSPAGADSAAVFLRLRNSLLTTVLFYELMLGDAGARSLDWLGEDLQQIGPAVDLGRWFVERMGLRVSVREGGEYREVARIPEPGPIAWKELAVMVPVPREDSLHIRLSFVADGWRIDQVGVAAQARHPSMRAIPLTEVRDAEGAPNAEALAYLQAPDERYLQTTPGQRFTIHFDVGEGESRTFLLASQGYYTEWVRGEWIRSARSDSPFKPSDESLFDALTRWRAQQESMEANFYSSRIPVR